MPRSSSPPLIRDSFANPWASVYQGGVDYAVLLQTGVNISRGPTEEREIFYVIRSNQGTHVSIVLY